MSRRSGLIRQLNSTTLVTQKLRNRDPQMDVFFMDVIWPCRVCRRQLGAAAGCLFLRGGTKLIFGCADPPILMTDGSTACRCLSMPECFITAKIFLKSIISRRRARGSSWSAKRGSILAQERDPYLTGYSAQFKQYEGLVCNMMEFVLSNGGALWNEQRLQSTLDDPKAKEVVRFVRDQIIRLIANRGILAYQEPESLALFTQGKAIFHRNWPYAWEVA